MENKKYVASTGGGMSWVSKAQVQNELNSLKKVIIVDPAHEYKSKSAAAQN